MKFLPVSHKFSYAPLEPGQFRLLTISATTKSFEIELGSFPLDNAPAYDAISYTWGPKEAAVAVKCNGRRQTISPRLASMLHHLLLYRPRPRTHKIWTDAVCINQEDDPEKERQIPCIRTIYSKAQRVIIWLGEHENDSELVMRSMPDLTGKLYGLGNIRHVTDVPTSPLLTEQGLEPLAHHLWPAICQLYSRSSFTRLWVLQEATLSQESILMCGNSWLSWESFSAFTEAFSDTELIVRIANPEIRGQTRAGLFTAQWVDFLSSQVAEKGGDGELSSILEWGRNLNCTVKADRIYGLLGLILPELQNQIASLNLINYAKPYWRTYIDFAKWCLQMDPKLAFFSIACPNGKHPRILSGCPDWNTTKDYNSFRNYSSL